MSIYQKGKKSINLDEIERFVFDQSRRMTPEALATAKRIIFALRLQLQQATEQS